MNISLGEWLKNNIEKEKVQNKYSETAFDFFCKLAERKKKKIAEITEMVKEKISFRIRTGRTITPIDLGGQKGEFNESEFADLFRWATENGLKLVLVWDRPVLQDTDSDGAICWCNHLPANILTNLLWVFPTDVDNEEQTR